MIRYEWVFSSLSSVQIIPKPGDTHPHKLKSWNHLIELYEAWNKSEKANEWRAKLKQMEDDKE
jgi:hypothetical protein